MSSRNAKYGAFLHTGGRGISSLRPSHLHCNIGSLRFFRIPTIAMAQVVLIIHQSMLELDYFFSFLAWLKLLSSSVAWCHLIRITLAHCNTLLREKEATCKAAINNSDAWKRHMCISCASILASNVWPVVWPMKNFPIKYDCCLSLTALRAQLSFKNSKGFLVTYCGLSVGNAPMLVQAGLVAHFG